MVLTLISLIAIALYAVLIALLAKQATNTAASATNKAFVIGIIALSLHGYVCYQSIVTPTGIALGFFSVATLISWFIALTTLLGSLRIAIDKLLIPLYALAAITLLCALLFPLNDIQITEVTTGIAAHIVLSILAYSILTIASAQACALWLQNQALKAHKVGGILNVFPPLQTMEALLFQMVTSGVFLLAGSILSGVIFLEDIFAQHLVHKTAFSILALTIFSILLWGRHQKGWRGAVAIRWTLIGFAALVLGYFGSKFVLELILQR